MSAAFGARARATHPCALLEASVPVPAVSELMPLLGEKQLHPSRHLSLTRVPAGPHGGIALAAASCAMLTGMGV